MKATLEEISFEYANLFWSISFQMESFMTAVANRNMDYMFDLAKSNGFPYDFATFEEKTSGLINLNLGKEQLINRFIRFMFSNKSR